MKEITFLLQDLLQEAIRRRDMQANVSATFGLVKKEIAGLIKNIQDCENIGMADKYFDELQPLQEALSQLLFEYDFKIPAELVNFVGEYDRLDDIRLREYLFAKIKNNEYSFDTLSVE